jgi:hypothetical protein
MYRASSRAAVRCAEVAVKPAPQVGSMRADADARIEAAPERVRKDNLFRLSFVSSDMRF